MLCSAKELGLSENAEGILELPADAPVGKPLREYLELDDAVLELNVTPNRGDAMSVLGIAREVAALAGTEVAAPAVTAVQATSAETLPVAPEGPWRVSAVCRLHHPRHRQPGAHAAVAARAPAPCRRALHQLRWWMSPTT